MDLSVNQENSTKHLTRQEEDWGGEKSKQGNERGGNGKRRERGGEKGGVERAFVCFLLEEENAVEQTISKR